MCLPDTSCQYGLVTVDWLVGWKLDDELLRGRIEQTLTKLWPEAINLGVRLIAASRARVAEASLLTER
jgi:hypothetical protein